MPERKPFDRQEYFLSRKRVEKSPRNLMAVTRSAVGLAKDASPRLFWLCAAGQILVAVLLGVQVLMGKLAL